MNAALKVKENVDAVANLDSAPNEPFKLPRWHGCSEMETCSRFFPQTKNMHVRLIGGSSSVSSDCQAGCATCSALNGCLSCKPRFFFHLELDGIRQRGTCLSSCPRGYFGARSPLISTCTKCKADCASCFSENFCTRCHPGRFLLRGKCESSCPNGLTANSALRECTECPAGCEQCVRRNMCTRCRADLYHLHGQCHHTCPNNFEPYVQLMQCVPRIFSSLIVDRLLKFTVRLDNGQVGVLVFGKGARLFTGGGRKPALDESSVPRAALVTPVLVCQRSGSVETERDRELGCRER
uniref:R-spondin 3 n=1 Tax=Nothobranchius kadleci TaxID=1051664 RepID=A0A1A8D3E9_NOTKA